MVGGEAVHSLGYMYVVTPVLLNVVVIFLVAVLFNWLFKWRRYPAKLVKKSEAKSSSKPSVSHEAIEHALRQIDSFIDVSEADLNEIYRLARAFDQKSDKKPD